MFVVYHKHNRLAMGCLYACVLLHAFESRSVTLLHGRTWRHRSCGCSRRLQFQTQYLTFWNGCTLMRPSAHAQGLAVALLLRAASDVHRAALSQPAFSKK